MFPTPVLGSAERPELPAPAQVSRSCAGFLAQVFNYTAADGCIAGPWLAGARGKSAALLLPAEKLLWAVGMGCAEGACVGFPISGGVFGELGRS